jgi:hypothetical protein
MTTDSQPKNTVIDLTPGKPGQPRKYTEEERKQHNREQVRKYYRENNKRCNFNNKLCKLRARGVVEWQGIVLTPKQWGNKRIYTDEEIKQCKRDYYKNNYYVNHRDVCLERARKAHLREKAAKAN